MPELIRIETEAFELTIWCRDVEKRLAVYKNTLEKRHASVDISPLRFTPAVAIVNAEICEDNVDQGYPVGVLSELPLEKSLFFENMQYQFEWIFKVPVDNAHIAHRLQSINASFRFTQSKFRMPARLTGVINTGNDVGWFRIPLNFRVGDEESKLSMAFEVLPTKMDISSDLPAMYQTIDSTYPLWRFNLAEKTEQDASKGKQRGEFPLLWLANFTSLREQLEKNLKVIAYAPHSRLQNTASFTRADRLKGRLNHRLVERVVSDRSQGLFDKRYRVEKKYLSVDTPENRFIKMVVGTCKNNLESFYRKLITANKAPDKQRLSDSFLEEIKRWQDPLKKMQAQSFLKEVGVFSGLNGESLVLQQKTGYSSVYKIWQELKYYLDVFSKQSLVSMKSVADIYEVWCFLTLRKILTDSLGFYETSRSSHKLKSNEFLEYQLKDGMAGAFEFERNDGLKAKLAHEPIFKSGGKNIRSYLVTQKPDVLLEVEFPDGKRCIWLFDAKYRIKTKNDRYDDADIDNTDFVPDDAINQMHRYRDALININNKSGSEQKSRSVFGAFALYPGYFEQEEEKNPYAEAIDEVGIGAFPLLPTTNALEANKSGCFWLEEFLKKQLGSQLTSYNSFELQENLYIQEAARIPYYGMKQALYPDLVMTAAMASRGSRDDDYFTKFENGTASWYHLPERTFLKIFKNHIADELNYLAIVISKDNESNSNDIHYLWPVNKVDLLPRKRLSIEQAGKLSTSDESFYLFKLGKPLKLNQAVSGVPNHPFIKSMRLTTLSNLEEKHYFDDLEEVYKEAILN